MVLAGMPEGAPDAIDARAARLSFQPLMAPVCCARGAAIDVRQKLALMRLATFRWDAEGPVIDGRAPSGVIERLDDLPHCAALLAPERPEGGIRGEACGVRAAARTNQLSEDAFLLPGCALFPLDVVGGVLTPSSRIPDAMLADVTGDAPSLWDEARARFVIRYGEPAALIVDAAASDLRGRRSRGLHLKTLR